MLTDKSLILFSYYTLLNKTFLYITSSYSIKKLMLNNDLINQIWENIEFKQPQ